MYITEEEREKCRKVMEAYRELYEATDVLVVDAGKYGFVKLQYFRPESGFDGAVSYLESKEMFEDLWEEWYDLYLLTFAKGTPMAELDYEEMFKWLPADKKEELMDKRLFFADMADIQLSE